MLRYLQENNLQASCRAFAAEADALLRLVQPLGAHLQVKSLQTVLNEYAALEARAHQRLEFERAFGDDGDVRGLLQKLGAVMDHYLAVARRRPQAAAAGHEAAFSGAGPGCPRPSHAPPPAERSAGRTRKSAQPRRRSHDRESVFSSQQLFEHVGQPEEEETQLGEAIALRINTGGGAVCGGSGDDKACRPGVSFGASSGCGSDGCGTGTEECARGSKGGRGSGVRVDEMSVDEIVQSLLADPHAAAMLSTISRPATNRSLPTPALAHRSLGSTAASNAAGPHADLPAHAPAKAHASATNDEPATDDEPTKRPRLLATDAKTHAAAPPPALAAASTLTLAPSPTAFPPRVDVAAFLNRLHGSADGNGKAKGEGCRGSVDRMK